MSDEMHYPTRLFSVVASMVADNGTMLIYTVLIQLFSFILSDNYNFSSTDFIHPIIATLMALCIYQLVFKDFLYKLKKKYPPKNSYETFSVSSCINS
jgi:hypothetical protein